MPLSEAGKKTKAAMMKHYGKDKGERIFYAYENKHKGKMVRGAIKRKK